MDKQLHHATDRTASTSPHIWGRSGKGEAAPRSESLGKEGQNYVDGEDARRRFLAAAEENTAPQTAETFEATGPSWRTGRMFRVG